MVTDITDKEFITLRDYIYNTIGIKLGDEKKSLVFSRLRVVLKELNFTNFSDYFKYLQQDKSGTSVI